MAQRQIGHRKSSLVLTAHFPVVKWRSHSVDKSAYYHRDGNGMSKNWNIKKQQQHQKQTNKHNNNNMFTIQNNNFANVSCFSAHFFVVLNNMKWPISRILGTVNGWATDSLL